MAKKSAENFFYWYKNLVKLVGQGKKFKINAGRTVFNFSCKTSGFVLVFSLFEKKNSILTEKFKILIKSA